MTHDDLADSLAGHLRGPGRMVWTDMQLGPAGSPRPDVYTLECSYRNPKPTAYEVKVSRSDFFADVTAGKYLKYRDYAEAVVFATPAGLVKPGEVPAGCGLMVYAGDWRALRRATRSACAPPQDVWMKLLIDGVGREGGHVRMETGRRWRAEQEAAKRFGQTLARAVTNAEYAPELVANAEREAAFILERARAAATRIRAEQQQDAPVLWSKLLEVLGLPGDASSHKVSAAVYDLREVQRGAVAVDRLLPELARMEKAVASLRGMVGSEGQG